MTFDVLDLLALVALAGVLWGYCVPLGREPIVMSAFVEVRR